MEAMNLKILKVETKVEDNRYDRPHDVGNSRIFSTPKQFVVSYQCETVPVSYGDEVVTVYFTHRFDFDELMSPAGGCYSCRKESEFVLFLKGKREEHIGGLRGDETYFTCYGQFVSKFQEGEFIYIKGSVEEKVSKAGKKYLQMKRVKVDRNFNFHSFAR